MLRDSDKIAAEFLTRWAERFHRLPPALQVEVRTTVHRLASDAAGTPDGRIAWESVPREGARGRMIQPTIDQCEMRVLSRERLAKFGPPPPDPTRWLAQLAEVAAKAMPGYQPVCLTRLMAPGVPETPDAT